MSEDNDSGQYEFAPREPAPEPTLAPKPEPAPSPAAEVAPQPTPERICPHCGFHVVGKTAKNRCPDCNGDLSASDDLLQFSSPAWTRNIANGFLLFIPAVALHCTAMTIVWASESPIAGAGCHVVAALLDVAGAWISTKKERRKNIPRMPVRLLVRVFALVTLGLSAALVPAVAARNAPSATSLILFLHFTLAALACAIALYIRALSLRMPSDSLQWWSQNLAALLPLVVLAQLPFNLLGRAKAEFLMLFMCAIPMAGGFTALALAACWTLLRTFLELRTCATTAELIVSRRIQRQKLQEEKKSR